jgi:cell division septation protein DedD
MFSQADKSFGDVQKFYPGTDAAARAAARLGEKEFYVEIGKFTDTAGAEKAAGTLRNNGFAASRANDGGEQIVRIGPLATYNDAKAVQSQVFKDYPKAIIMP